MKIGSEEHKQLFCQSFLESHRLYEPEAMNWPELDHTTLERLRGIPFWEEALYTERRAGAMLKAYAETVEDPLIQQAISLQGREEARHGRLIQYLIDHYGIELPPKPDRPIPSNIEPAFIKFGYGECFDSFFAFGLFEVARQAGLMPEAFFTIFDPILDEEARHMVFFINWINYRLAARGAGALRGVNAFSQYVGALQRRLDSLQGMGKKKSNSQNKKGFTATGAKALTLDLTLEKFLTTCLEENARRMSVYDEQLLKPEFIPILTGVALNVLRLRPKRKARPVADPA